MAAAGGHHGGHGGFEQYGNGASSPEPQVLPDFLRPGASYIAPTSGYFFGQVAHSLSLEQSLPTKDVGDRLMQRYFDAVHPIARCVHRPTVESLYQNFWQEVRDNYEPRASVQSIIFAAWFSAVVSLEEAQAQDDYGLSKAQMVQHMKIATETALSKANFLRTTKFETLQAFVMYLLPLCREEVSRAHSVLVGAAVRMAECMGLHRDGEAYGLNPLEAHVRRLVWHQLCFLDIRTCEAQGPKPAIRREDYDTKLPINCEEHELKANSMVAPAAAEGWTPALLSIMRFELNEMMRIIWSDRRRLESRKMTLTMVLAKIEGFRKRMIDRYDRFLDNRIPIQRYARLVMHLLLHRLHAMVLHPYHTNTASAMPDRLNSVLISSGVTIIENAVQLERDLAYRDWAWYLGAYQQYQIALLLVTEIYYRPQNQLADRIWGCLDYVFSLEAAMPREHKALQILSEIMSKTHIYMGMRKMRAPTSLVRAVPGKMAVKESPSPPMQQQGLSLMGQLHLQQQQQQQQQAQAQQQMAVVMQGLKQEPGSGGNGNGVPALQQHQQQQHGLPNLNMHGMNMNNTMVGFPNHQHHGHGMDGMPPPPLAAARSMSIGGGIPLLPPGMMPLNMEFAGVTDGTVLWGLPPHAGSPENSSDGDGGSVAGAHRHGSISGPAGAGAGGFESADHSNNGPGGNVQQPHQQHQQGQQQMNPLMEGIDWVSYLPDDESCGENTGW